MLTEHQLLHINAVIRDCEEALDDSAEKMIELALNKGIEHGKAISYFNLVKRDAEKIIKDGTFPLERASDIHDYLEKGRTL